MLLWSSRYGRSQTARLPGSAWGSRLFFASFYRPLRPLALSSHALSPLPSPRPDFEASHRGENTECTEEGTNEVFVLGIGPLYSQIRAHLDTALERPRDRRSGFHHRLEAAVDRRYGGVLMIVTIFR